MILKGSERDLKGYIGLDCHFSLPLCKLSAAVPSRNHQVVNSNHAGNDVIVTLQQPQAKPRLLPKCFEGFKLDIC